MDGALLDIDVHGQTSYGIFEALEERGVPCVFVTAFTAEHIPAAYAHVPRLEKPMGSGAVLAALRELSTGPARA